MAGRGMGAATKGGGCVGSGSRNKMTSKPSSKVEVMMAEGGDVKSKGKKKGLSPTGSGIVMALEAMGVKAKDSSSAAKAIKEKESMPKKKMGGGMMNKYKHGGYAGK